MTGTISWQNTSYRSLALLRATAAGRVEITGSGASDMYVDGLSCSDQSLARHMTQTRLVEPAVDAAPGERVRARLTALGRALLAEHTDPDGAP